MSYTMSVRFWQKNSLKGQCIDLQDIFKNYIFFIPGKKNFAFRYHFAVDSNSNSSSQRFQTTLLISVNVMLFSALVNFNESLEYKHSRKKTFRASLNQILNFEEHNNYEKN